MKETGGERAKKGIEEEGNKERGRERERVMGGVSALQSVNHFINHPGGMMRRENWVES